MSDEVAISVEGVDKSFILPHERVNTVKGLFTGLTRKRSKTVETQHALKNISFKVKKGEFFGIVGRNGSGKSTMLKILAGIYQPTSGRVSVKGKLVPFIELGVGFNGELTGRENVYLNGAMLGFSQKELDEMYEDIVKFAELERFMDQKLKNYSSGMQVRLAFSMATRADSDILLVDEVLAVGDADFQPKCFEYFKNLKKNKKTVVFVSHDMSAVRQYCDRAILIEKSKLVMQGPSEDVAAEYTRMFNEGATAAPGLETKNKRWGNEKVIIQSVIVNPYKLLEKKQQLQITMELMPKVNIENAIAGFVIKDGSGTPVTGTNTRLLEQSETGKWKAGSPVKMVWSLPNIFSDGSYSIDTAVLQDDASTVCDWWESSAKFVCLEKMVTPYFVNPDISLKIGD